MQAFRLIALVYALVVLLIAPAWLTAGEQVPPAVPAPAAEEPAAAVQDTVPTVPELPVGAAQEPDEAEAEPAPEPEATPEPEPAPAKAEKKQKPEPKEPTAKASASASVTISDFKFTPATVTVNEGDTVTWTNDGPTVHTATAEDGSFDTGTLRKGDSGSATFTQAGTVAYICTPHPFMHGKVVVQAASAGSGDDSGSTGGSGDGSSDDGDTGGVAGDDLSSDDGSGLPATGFEVLLIALLGVATLAAGLLLRRRSEA